MTDEERPVCDCPEPCGCYAEGYARARTRPTSRSWPALTVRPMTTTAVASPAK